MERWVEEDRYVHLDVDDWCEEVGKAGMISTDREGRDVLAFTACFGSVQDVRGVILNKIPVHPHAIHWLLMGIRQRDLGIHVVATTNERIDLLLHTGQMRPMDKLHGETVMDIYRSFPPEVTEFLDDIGFTLDVSKFETPVEHLFKNLTL